MSTRGAGTGGCAITVQDARSQAGGCDILVASELVGWATAGVPCWSVPTRTAFMLPILSVDLTADVWGMA